jgi:hypothetical protein
MNGQLIPTPDDLRALYALPSRVPGHETPETRSTRETWENRVFWGSVGVFLGTFWTGVYVAGRALWGAFAG